MWLMLNTAFVSIVKKDCAADELMIRARRKGDIERIFPDAKVTRYTKSDYLYRAPVKTSVVIEAMKREVEAIDYSNFKDSVDDKDLHDAYLDVWHVMAETQEVPPYSGYGRQSS